MVAGEKRKFQLPPRESRPPDDTYVDHVLGVGGQGNGKLGGDAAQAASLEPEPVLPREDEAREEEVSGERGAASIRSVTSLPSSREREIENLSEFRKRWARFLTETQLKLCEAFFAETVAKGRSSYDTTSSEIREIGGKSKRHTFLVLDQLEEMGFITRKQLKVKNRLIGIRITFRVVPTPK